MLNQTPANILSQSNTRVAAGRNNGTSAPVAATSKNQNTENTFGSVLARQIEDRKGSDNTSATSTPLTANKSADATTDTAALTSSALTSSFMTDMAVVPADAAAMAINAVMLGNQAVKMTNRETNTAALSNDQPATAAPELISQATANLTNENPLQSKDDHPAKISRDTRKPEPALPGTPDAAAMASVAGLLIQPEGKPTATPKTGDADNDSTAVRSTNITASHQRQQTTADNKLEHRLSSTSKAEATLTEPVVVKNALPAESFKTAEQALKLPDTAPAAQAQSASSMANASLQATTPLNTNQNSIAAALGSSAWPEEFTQKVNWISTQQNQVAELHLNPPDLGPMSVTLTITDNQATAQFSSPHSAVREAIENAMPKLRESLADNGIMLGNATVSDQAPRDRGTNNFNDQRPGSRPEFDRSITTESATSALQPIVTRRHNGMVDTFA